MSDELMNYFVRVRCLIGLIVLIAATACDTPLIPNDPSPGLVSPVAPGTRNSQPPGSITSAVPSTHSIDSLKQAWRNTQRSSTYRMTLNFVLGSSESGQFAEQPFLNFDAQINGNASHVTYTGGSFNEVLGGGERIEVMSIANKAYLRGSTLFGTADPDQWYFLADSTIGKPPFDLGDMLAQMGDDVEKAKAVGTEKVDGLECQAWLLDFRNKAGLLIDTASTEYNQDDFNAIDSAEARFNQCADGFIHRLTWDIHAHNQRNANERGALKVRIHLFDFNATNIIIRAPDGAIELK